MALSDPLVFTLDAINHNLARVRVRDMASDYQNADQTLFETVSHQNSPTRKNESGPGVRSLISVQRRKIVADPLNAESQEFKTLGIQIVFDRPVYGFTATEVDALWAALKAQVNTAFVTKIVGQES